MSDQAQLTRDVKPKSTQEHKAVYDAITKSAISEQGGVFMIDAPAGTGKTFTERAITANLRASGKLVICAASTGIAALILPGGLTAHSTYKLPFGDDTIEDSVCNVKAESQRADVLKRASWII